MSHNVSRRTSLAWLASLAASPLLGCASFPRDELDKGILEGRVLVEWDREDKFIYRVRDANSLRFKPSFLNDFIVPQEMYTDGGSIPRIFWSIPGLSPWGMGPAYIMHDWLFEVHRCNRPAPPHEKAITFEQSARILAEVGVALVKSGLIDHDLLDQVVWAVRTRYARSLWDRPGTPEECQVPPPVAKAARLSQSIVADFVIPPPRS